MSSFPATLFLVIGMLFSPLPHPKAMVQPYNGSDSDCSGEIIVRQNGSLHTTQSTATPGSSQELKRVEKKPSKEHTRWEDAPRTKVASSYEEQLPDDELLPRSFEQALKLTERLNSKIWASHGMCYPPTTFEEAVNLIAKMKEIREEIDRKKEQKRTKPQHKKPHPRHGGSPAKRDRGLELRLKIQTQRADAAEARYQEMLATIEGHLKGLGE